MASRNTYVIDTLLHGCDFLVTPLKDVVLVAYTISTAAATPPSVPPSVPTLAFSARNARASTTTTRFPSLLLSFSFSFFLSFLFVFWILRYIDVVVKVKTGSGFEEQSRAGLSTPIVFYLHSVKRPKASMFRLLETYVLGQPVFAGASIWILVFEGFNVCYVSAIDSWRRFGVCFCSRDSCRKSGRKRRR